MRMCECVGPNYRIHSSSWPGGGNQTDPGRPATRDNFGLWTSESLGGGGIRIWASVSESGGSNKGLLEDFGWWSNCLSHKYTVLIRFGQLLSMGAWTQTCKLTSSHRIFNLFLPNIQEHREGCKASRQNLLGRTCSSAGLVGTRFWSNSSPSKPHPDTRLTTRTRSY